MERLIELFADFHKPELTYQLHVERTIHREHGIGSLLNQSNDRAERVKACAKDAARFLSLLIYAVRETGAQVPGVLQNVSPFDLAETYIARGDL